MAEPPNTTEPVTLPRRWYQFRLRTLLVCVTLLGLVAGAIRWLVILAGAQVAVAVVVGISLSTAYALGCSKGLWVWQQWCRWQANRDRAWEIESTRLLLESEEVREAIRVAKGDDPRK